MKKVIILTLLFATLISIFACQKDPVSSYNQETSARISFKNDEEFMKTFDDLSKLSSKEEMDRWSKSKGYSNLLNSEDEDLETLPYAFLTILNKNAEFEMNDSIIWYHSGQLYKFAKQDEEEIQNLKMSPEKCQVAGHINTQVVESVEDRTATINTNTVDAAHQYQFTQTSYQPCGGALTFTNGVRKYVHEVRSYSYTSGYTSYNRLFLRLKLEYRTSNNKWRSAGEKREMEVDVFGDASISPGGLPTSFSVNQSLTCANDVEFLIGYQLGYGYTPSSWTLNMSGSITHSVMGDNPSNTWVNSGQLW